MRKRNRLVCGVGISDSDYQIRTQAILADGSRRWSTCPIYQVWRSMLSRCYSLSYQAGKPTYIGCSVDPEWLRFSNFSKWMLSQNWEGLALDKDIIIPGNKVYASDRCVFISQSLNSFLNDHGASQGEWPIGVHLHAESGRFRSECSNPFTGKRERLGGFSCPHAAHDAWRSRKHQHALRYADMQIDQRIAESLRARYSEIKEKY